MLFKTVKEEKLKGKKNSEVLKFVDELYRNAQIYVALRVGDYETYLHELIKNRRNEVLEEEIREHIEFLGFSVLIKHMRFYSLILTGIYMTCLLLRFSCAAL